MKALLRAYLDECSGLGEAIAFASFIVCFAVFILAMLAAISVFIPVAIVTIVAIVATVLVWAADETQDR